MKKIGILGSGVVGKTLAKGFLKYGYPVKIATRTPGKLDDWLHEEGAGATVGNFKETAGYGDILVLAVKGAAAEEVVTSLEKEMFGKTVIDTTNPIAEVGNGGVLNFFTGANESLFERLQTIAPDANFVKAFNSIGSAHMVNPKFKQGTPTMFICGNSASAKLETKGILEQFGFEVEDLGEVEAARAIEPLCILWCIPGFRENSWTHAFKLLKE